MMVYPDQKIAELIEENANLRAELAALHDLAGEELVVVAARAMWEDRYPDDDWGGVKRAVASGTLVPRYETILGHASAVLAAIVPSLRAEGWRTMESAPMDSRARLVWCPERQNTYVVTWWLDGWAHFGAGGGGKLMELPSHWRPLPPPPDAAP